MAELRPDSLRRTGCKPLALAILPHPASRTTEPSRRPFRADGLTTDRANFRVRLRQRVQPFIAHPFATPGVGEFLTAVLDAVGRGDDVHFVAPGGEFMRVVYRYAKSIVHDNAYNQQLSEPEKKPL